MNSFGTKGRDTVDNIVGTQVSFVGEVEKAYCVSKGTLPQSSVCVSRSAREYSGREHQLYGSSRCKLRLAPGQAWRIESSKEVSAAQLELR